MNTTRNRRTLPHRAAAVLAALALATSFAACAPDDAEPQPTETSTSAAEVEIPDTPVGEAATFVIGELNADSASEASGWEERLAASFTEQVSVEQLLEIVHAYAQGAPYTVTSYDGDDTTAVATITSEVVGALDVSLALDGDGLIAGLQFSPSTGDYAPAASLTEVEERLSALSGDVRWTILRDGEVVSENGADELAPMGSIFKLWVLAAVSEKIDAGDGSWDDTLTVTEATKSLPSGELQNLPGGTTVTVRDAASKMISISDNTATDLLIDYVGRENVEAILPETGNTHPEALTPFLKTREAFVLAFTGGDELRERWKDADESERRDILTEIAAQPVSINDLESVPMWESGIEWFATADDIAAVLAWLFERSDPEIAAILTANPGVQVDTGVWPVIGFKGGNSPGVLAGSWHAEDAGGTTLTIVIQQASSDLGDVAQGQVEVFGLAQDLFTIVE